MRRALTIIETLVAVTLVGLAGGILAIGLGGVGDAARITEAVSIARDLDQRARSVAQAEAGATLRSNGGLLRVEVGSSDQRSVVAERQTHRAVSLSLRAPSGAILETIRFDGLGRSRDYVVTIEASDHRATLAVCGLTGWIEEAP